MHDENVVVVGSDLPWRADVFVTLQMVEDGGADDGAVLLLHEKIAAGERSFGGGAGWVDIAHPADGGAAGFLLGVDGVVDGGDLVQVAGDGLAEHRKGLLSVGGDVF